jgi:hypothetical protein
LYLCLTTFITIDATATETVTSMITIITNVARISVQAKL